MKKAFNENALSKISQAVLNEFGLVTATAPNIESITSQSDVVVAARGVTKFDVHSFDAKTTWTRLVTQLGEDIKNALQKFLPKIWGSTVKRDQVTKFSTMADVG